MRRALLLVFGLLGVGGVASHVHGSEDFTRLSDLSGSWIGRRSVEPDGKCTIARTRHTVAYDIFVDDSGAIQLQHMGMTTAKGRVTPSGEVTFGEEHRRAFCGGKERTYTAQFKGKFSRKGESLHLRLEAIDSPCPPCRFKERLRLTNIELEW